MSAVKARILTGADRNYISILQYVYIYIYLSLSHSLSFSLSLYIYIYMKSRLLSPLSCALTKLC